MVSWDSDEERGRLVLVILNLFEMLEEKVFYIWVALCPAYQRCSVDFSSTAEFSKTMHIDRYRYQSYDSEAAAFHILFLAMHQCYDCLRFFRVMCCEISQDRADVEMVRFAKPATKLLPCHWLKFNEG